MLEKARIHRAMLRLSGSFGASDLVRDAGSAFATVRKNIERDCRAGWLMDAGSRHSGSVGGPEKLYRLTEAGRHALSSEAERAYAALAGTSPSATEQPKEPVALAAARVTLASLRKDGLEPRKFFGRLRVAAAELEAASHASGEAGFQARRLAKVIRARLPELDRLLRNDRSAKAFETARSRILAEITEASEPSATLLDRLMALVPQLRQLAERLTQARDVAEELVQGTLADLLANRHQIVADLQVQTLAYRRLEERSSQASALHQSRPRLREQVATGYVPSHWPDFHPSGQLINDVPPKDRDVATVFQRYALYPHMTVFENMSFGLRLKKFPNPEIRDRVHAAARTLDITGLLDRRPGELSGGQRQRVAMGRAMVRNPGALLFDEPLSNFDAGLQPSKMRTEISKVHQKVTTATVYVTRDQIKSIAAAESYYPVHSHVIARGSTDPAEDVSRLLLNNLV
jgi:ABC-type thiamine transport system ATPase subunit